MKPKILGLITARGGSKGIAGKNTKLLLGKPLIAYTIKAAQKSAVFDRLIVSTDDFPIAKIAQELGGEVPFMRPSDLAQDSTPHLPVVQHAVQWLKDNENYWSDFVMILQPTTPLRQSFHIKEAVELIVKTGADSVVAVCLLPEYLNPGRSLFIADSEGNLKLYDGRPLSQRAPQRQAAPAAYWNTTMIYLFKTDLLFDPNNPSFFGDQTVPYVVESKYAFYIT